MSYSALLWFFGSFAASAYVTRWLLDRRAKRLEAERVKADEDFKIAMEAMQASIRARLKMQMLLFEMRNSARAAQMEYETAYADHVARAARRDGSLDSTCVEVPEKKRIH